MVDKRPNKDEHLRSAIQLLRAALETAPNPHQVDGPPALWAWYDDTRTAALDVTKDL